MSELRFDVYSVIRIKNEFHITKLCKDIALVSAEIMSGVTNHDFVESVANEGWVGTCPQWREYMPVVTVPTGDLLKIDHLVFMMESVEAW